MWRYYLNLCAQAVPKVQEGLCACLRVLTDGMTAACMCMSAPVCQLPVMAVCVSIS